MKKLVWSAAFLWCATSLVSCAIPERTTVGRPMPPKPAPPVTTTSSGPAASPDTATTVPQPLYLEPNEQQPQHFQEQDIENSLPSMAYINDRLFEYGRKLDRWKELDRKAADAKMTPADSEQMVICFRQLQGVLNGYGELRAKLLQSTGGDEEKKVAGDEIWSLQKVDIEFIEGLCGALLKDKKDEGAGWTSRDEGAGLGQQETLIDRYASNREYEEAVKIWQQIPEDQVNRVNLRAKIQYANALVHLQQVDKAAAVYKQVVEQMAVSDEQATDLVSLRKVLADLYTAAGDYSSALAQYNKIADDFQKLSKIQDWAKQQVSILDRAKDDSPELKEYSNMLKNFLSYQPQRDGYKIVWQADQFVKEYPYSSVAANVDVIRAAAQQAADKWFGGVMSEVDRLNKQKRYDEGLKLLETVPSEIVAPQMQQSMKDKNQEIVLTEAVNKETEKMAAVQELQKQWNNGMLLAKNGRYDEAINVFTELLSTEYDAKAKEKIKELSLEAANDDRRKAADMFRRFLKTTDIESRKKLLIESRTLLKSILVKYPDVEIGPKVLGNIARVEQEINALDPNLLATLDKTPDAGGAKVDGVDQTFETQSTTMQSNTPAEDTPPEQAPPPSGGGSTSDTPAATGQ